MSRRTERSPDPDEQVRRWLAEARHTDPMPGEVAERMDRVIAGLAEDPSRRVTVVRLADRRRRAATMLVAAAAVVVAGVGVAQVVGDSGGQAESALDASTAEEEPAAEEGAAVPEAAATDRGGRLTDGLTAQRQLARLRPGSFAEDAAALRDRVVASYQAGSLDERNAADGRSAQAQPRQPVCRPGDWGRGSYRAVSYDGAPGYLVFRRPRGDTQVADLFLCGSEVAIRSVTLPR